MKILRNVISVILVICIAAGCFVVSGSAADTARTPQTMSNVVIFVKFADDSTDEFNGTDTYGKSNWAEIKGMYNNTSTLNQYGIDLSFKKYISEISNGQVIINNCFPQDNGDTVTTYTLSQSRAGYSDDYYVLQEVIEATRNGSINIPSGIKLDNRESEVLDNLTVVFQVSAYPGNDEMLYPHKSIAANSVKLADSVYVRCYNFLNSYAVLHSQYQGVITHEFMHSMGFADLYRYADGSGTPVGAWDIMSQVGRYLQYPLTYFRAHMGWVSIDKLTAAGRYTLNPVTSKEGNQAFIIETPMSDSEFFVVEYRVRNTSALASLAFESKVPQTGLLVYRINTAVEEMSNSAGNDYVYVFRQGVSSLTAADGDILYASVSPDSTYNPRSSIGSTDLSKTFTLDTLYYSDGRNSGISLSDIAMDSVTGTLSFDLSFADYSATNMWEKLGESIDSESGNVCVDAVSDSEIYVSYETTDYPTCVKTAKWNGDSWGILGNTISNASVPVIKKVGSTVYLFYQNNGTPIIAELNGSSWTTIGTASSGTYPQGCDIISDGTDVYITYTVADAQNIMQVDKITAAGLTPYASYTSSQYIVNPKLCFLEGELYAVLSLFDGSNTQILKNSSGTFSTVRTIPLTYGNVHGASVSDGKLCCFAANSNSAAKLSVFDGDTWTDSEISALNEAYSDNEFTVVNGIPYIARISGTGNTLKVYSYEDGVLTQLGDNVVNDSDDASLAVCGNTVYAASSTGAAGALSVRFKQLEVSPATLQAVTVKNQPDKLNYKVGEALDTAGLTLTLHYSDGTTADTTSGFTCSPTVFTAYGTKTVTVNYGGMTSTFDVNVTCNADSHVWDNGTVVTPATCTEDGEIIFTCSLCKATKTEVIAAAGSHSWDSGVLTKVATCTEDGIKTYTCSVCKATKTEVVAKTAHTLRTETISADCTNGGFSRDVCTVCGTVTRVYNQTPALGHVDANADNICDVCAASLSAPQEDCDCMCHQTGFMQFIYKILRIFYKLFGINKYCKCGEAHY